MKIYDMFEKKITRDIKGVIKVGQKDDICKIKEMTDPCGEFKYKYGYSIMLNNEKKGKDRYRIVPV